MVDLNQLEALVARCDASGTTAVKIKTSTLRALIARIRDLERIEAGVRQLHARMGLDLGAGKDSYTYTQYEQGRVAEKRKAMHELAALLPAPPADGEK